MPAAAEMAHMQSIGFDIHGKTYSMMVGDYQPHTAEVAHTRVSVCTSLICIVYSVDLIQE
jgi:hypothetical protein